MNFCEFLYINFYGYYKNFIITLILTWFFLKKSPIINSALTKLLSLTRLEPSQQQQQQQPGAEPSCAVYRSPGFHALMAFSDW